MSSPRDSWLQHAYLFLHVVEGKRLSINDINGFSDPYCVIQLGDAKRRSRCLKKTLNPQWDQVFCLPLSPAEANQRQLYIQVWDKDTLTADDFMGEISLLLSSLSDQAVHEQWYELKPSPTIKGNVSGSLRLRLRYFDWTRTAEACRSTQEEKQAGGLRVIEDLVTREGLSLCDAPHMSDIFSKRKHANIIHFPGRIWVTAARNCDHSQLHLNVQEHKRFTISFWLYVAVVSPRAFAVLMHSNLYFGIDVNGFPEASVGGSQLLVFGPYPVPREKWVHVALVCSMAQQSVVVYLDSLPETQHATGSYPTHIARNTLSVGPDSPGLMVEDLSFLAWAATPEQIKLISERTVPHPMCSEVNTGRPDPKKRLSLFPLRFSRVLQLEILRALVPLLERPRFKKQVLRLLRHISDDVAAAATDAALAPFVLQFVESVFVLLEHGSVDVVPALLSVSDELARMPAPDSAQRSARSGDGAPPASPQASDAGLAEVLARRVGSRAQYVLETAPDEGIRLAVVRFSQHLVTPGARLLTPLLNLLPTERRDVRSAVINTLAKFSVVGTGAAPAEAINARGHRAVRERISVTHTNDTDRSRFYRYYCGQAADYLCPLCDGTCGPVSGCNCSGCRRLDVQYRNGDSSRGENFVQIAQRLDVDTLLGLLPLCDPPEQRLLLRMSTSWRIFNPESRRALPSLGRIDVDLHHLQRERSLCDLAFDVGGERFWAHKPIVCLRCPYFAELSRVQQRARSADPEIEAIDSQIPALDASDQSAPTVLVLRLDCEQPALFAHVLHYLYSDRLPRLTYAEAHGVYAMAEQFQLDALQQACVTAFCKDVRVENVVDAIRLLQQTRAGDPRDVRRTVSDLPTVSRSASLVAGGAAESASASRGARLRAPSSPSASSSASEAADAIESVRRRATSLAASPASRPHRSRSFNDATPPARRHSESDASGGGQASASMTYCMGFLKKHFKSVGPDVDLEALGPRVLADLLKMETPSSIPAPLPPQATFAKDVQRLYHDRELADCCVRVKDKTVSAHRCVLGARSHFFAMAFGSGMREAASGEVTLHNLSSLAVFDVLLQFMYRADANFPDVPTALELLTELDFFELSNARRMHQLCVDYLRRTVGENVSSEPTLVDDTGSWSWALDSFKKSAFIAVTGDGNTSATRPGLGGRNSCVMSAQRLTRDTCAARVRIVNKGSWVGLGVADDNFTVENGQVLGSQPQGVNCAYFCQDGSVPKLQANFAATIAHVLPIHTADLVEIRVNFDSGLVSFLNNGADVGQLTVPAYFRERPLFLCANLSTTSIVELERDYQHYDPVS